MQITEACESRRHHGRKSGKCAASTVSGIEEQTWKEKVDMAIHTVYKRFPYLDIDPANARAACLAGLYMLLCASSHRQVHKSLRSRIHTPSPEPS